jgi:hypothetical protein
MGVQKSSNDGVESNDLGRDGVVPDFLAWAYQFVVLLGVFVPLLLSGFGYELEIPAGLRLE